MNTKLIHDVMAETQAGKLIFPEVVRRLLEAGVESYFVDLAKAEEAVYLLDGKTQVEKMTLPLSAIAEEFSLPGIVSAIGAAQTDTIRYSRVREPRYSSRRDCLLGISDRQEGDLFRPRRRVSR